MKRDVYKEYREAIVNFVAERDGWKCWLCGKLVVWPDVWIDHCIPVEVGGAHRLSNFRLSHRRCNIGRPAQRRRLQGPRFIAKSLDKLTSKC